MYGFVVGVAILLAWWSAWTTYIQYLRRTGQFRKFHSGVYDACMLIFALAALLASATGLAPFQLRQFNMGTPEILTAIAVGLVLWVGQVVYLHVRSRRISGGTSIARYPNRWPWALPITGAAEEIIFRGCLLLGLVEAGVPAWTAVVVSAAIFGLVHVFQFGLYGIALHSLTGLAFGVLAVGLDLGAALVAHAAFNLFVVLMSGGRHPAARPAAEGHRATGAGSVD